MSDFSLFEAMRTQRAIRRYSSKPVSEDDINTILGAAIRAPSGGNSQPWHFLVIRTSENRGKLAAWYREAWENLFKNMQNPEEELPQSTRSGRVLADAMSQVPVLILVCADRSTGNVDPVVGGASIFPAIQNLLLAARGLGLGSVLTTIHRRHEAEIKALLGIPEHVATIALIPVGYPAEGEHFGGSIRKPLKEVMFHEYWGKA